MEAIQEALASVYAPLYNSGVRCVPSIIDDQTARIRFSSCALRPTTGSDGHGGSEIIIRLSGEPEFVCHHHSCRGKTVADVMRKFRIPWQAPPRGLDLLPFDEWEKTITAKRNEIVCGLFGERDIVNVVGGSKLGKTYYLAQMVLSIAAGIDFLDHKTQCPAGQLLILDYELHSDVLKERINHLIDAMRIPQSVKRRIVYHTMRGHDFRRIDDVCQWLQSIEAGRFGLVAFDALYRALPVGMSENDNREFAEIYNLLAITADAHGCAFVLPSHSSKGDQSKRKSIDVGSGAGAQGRACDTHIVLREHPRVSSLAQMTVDVRSFKPSPPVSLRFSWPLWSVVEEDDFREPTPAPFTMADLLACVPEEPIKRSELVRQVYAANKTRIKKVDLDLLISTAINEGSIILIPGTGSRPNTIKRGKQ